MVNNETGFITIMHGADVSEETAEELLNQLQAKFGDRIEVMLVNGGQPVYYYIISVE